jgi:hypothetical protein
LSSKRNLDNHYKKCNGVDSLSCPICKKRFNSYQAKYKHLKTVKCTDPGKSINYPESNVTNITNNTNNNYNSCNFNTVNNNITINAFGKEDYQYIMDNHDFMRKCIKDREYGLLECLKMMHYNSDVPQNQNIKKLNRKDDFVDVYDGSKWKLRMIDYAYSQIMKTLEKLFTDYIDDLVETGELESMKRTIKVFCNKISTVLDWEFNNLDKNQEPEESEVKSLECKLKKLISETLYRESINHNESNL